MTEAEIRQALLSRFLVEFESTMPVETDNLEFSKPTDGSKWARATVQFNDESQDTYGRPTNRKFLGMGFFTVQIFTPINESTMENDTISNQVKNHMSPVRINDLWTFNGRVLSVGRSDRYWQQNVVIEFNSENIR